MVEYWLFKMGYAIANLNTLIAFSQEHFDQIPYEFCYKKLFKKNTAFSHTKNSSIVILNITRSLNMVIQTTDGWLVFID